MRIKLLPKKYKSGKRKRFVVLKNHPFVVPVVTLIVLVFGSGVIYVASQGSVVEPSDSNIVLVSHDQVQETVPSRATTVKEFLEQNNIELNKGDVVEPGVNATILEDNFRINVYRARPVTIYDGNKKTSTFTAAATPRSAAAFAGIKVYAEDEISTAPIDDVLREGIGEKIVINRAVSVALNLYGRQVNIRTHAKTVQELLDDRDIVLTEKDKVQPSLDTVLTPNTQVFVFRGGVKLVSVEEVVPAPIETIEDPNLTHGTTAVRQEGANGLQVVTYQIEIRNGKEFKRTAIQKVVTERPVTRIVVVGTAPLSLSLQEWLLQLRNCESGGNYQINTGNGYYGAYQFSAGTWSSLDPSITQGYARADLAPPGVQDQAIIANTNRSGSGLASQNPHCYQSLGLSAFPPANR